MKISVKAIEVLKEIYSISEKSHCNLAKIPLDETTSKLDITRIFLFKCLHYLNEKEFISGHVIYGETLTDIDIYISAKGIDIVEA